MDSLSSSEERKEGEVLEYTQGVFSLLSFVGSLFMIVSIIYLKRTTKPHGRFLLYLAISQLLLSLAFLLSSGFTTLDFTGPDDKFACVAQGLSIQFFAMSSWMWTSCIAGNMWINVVHYEKVLQNPYPRLELYLHALAWGIPLIICAICSPHVHPDREVFHLQWCWIGSQEDGYVFLFYVPLLVVLGINIFFIAHVVYKIVKEFSEKDEVLNGILSARNAAQVRGFTRQIILYPVILVVCFAGAYTDRMVAYFTEHSYFTLKILHQFMILDGFFSALVYGYSAFGKIYKKKWMGRNSQESVDSLFSGRYASNNIADF